MKHELLSTTPTTSKRALWAKIFGHDDVFVGCVEYVEWRVTVILCVCVKMFGQLTTLGPQSSYRQTWNYTRI